jgi:Predicted methyltransferase (contains TPR repeat)
MSDDAFIHPLDAAEDLLAQDRPGEAAGLLSQLIAERRGGVAARLALVRALSADGRLEEAIAAAGEAVSLYPDVGEAALAEGAVLLSAEHLPEAIASLQRALRLDPANGEARFLLGCAWLDAGESEPALAALSQLDPADGDVAAKIAEAEAIAARPRSDAGYVRHLFDQFSTDYDQRMLGQLQYQAPQTLRELAALVMPGMTGLAILDLGCGTGLSGAAFKDRAATLTGLDLSPAMIEKARARGVYDSLAVADIEAGLGDGLYDLVIAADTLVYIGDLETTFAAVAKALKDGGQFLFTTEAKEGEAFELGPKRRWRHSEAYLRAMAERHGFAVMGLLSCTPRHESHLPVPGFAVALRRA